MFVLTKNGLHLENYQLKYTDGDGKTKPGVIKADPHSPAKYIFEFSWKKTKVIESFLEEKFTLNVR